MHKISFILTNLVVFLFLFFNINFSIRAQEVNLWTSPLQKCWEYKTDYMTTFNLASDNNNTIYLQNSKGLLVAIDSNIGKRKWSIEVGGEFITNATNIINNTTFTITNNSLKKNDQSKKYQQSTLKKINLESGVVEDTQNLTSSKHRYILRDSLHKYIFTIDGEINSFDKQEKLIWKININSQITTSPIIIKDTIGFGTSNRTFVQVSKLDGKIINQLNLKSVPSGLPLYLNGKIFIGDKIGNIKAVSLVNGKISWNARTGGRIVSLKIWNEKILALSNDNYVYLLAAKNGKKIWKRKLTGRIIGNEFLDDGNSVFLTLGTNTIYLINLETGKLINQVFLDNNPYFVSSPISINRQIIVPTNKGIISYSPSCK